jgi:predicted acyl esterase
MKGVSSNGEGLTPRARTRRRRAIDAATARIFKMPPGHDDYTLTQAVRVPMRDGVNLLSDVYTPVGKSLGTLLIRTPYGRGGLITLLTDRYYATHGYRVVNQSCRGTSGSGGDFEPFRPDIDDGADTVAWLRRKPGSTHDSRCAAPLIWGIRPGP